MLGCYIMRLNPCNCDLYWMEDDTVVSKVSCNLHFTMYSMYQYTLYTGTFQFYLYQNVLIYLPKYGKITSEKKGFEK